MRRSTLCRLCRHTMKRLTTPVGCACVCHPTAAVRRANRRKRTIRVYVYRHDYDKTTGGKGYYTLTYTRYQSSGACIHDVEAIDGYDAKKIAAKQHAEACGNRVTP